MIAHPSVRNVLFARIGVPIVLSGRCVTTVLLNGRNARCVTNAWNVPCVMIGPRSVLRSARHAVNVSNVPIAVPVMSVPNALPGTIAVNVPSV